MKRTILKDIVIEQIAPEGKAIARVDGKVIFIDKALPGDVVDVRLTKQKKDFALGEIVALQQASTDRIDAFCEHFGTCGGCTWQHASYDNQLKYKTQIVADAFKRVGKIDIEMILPIVGADKTEYYRNKTEYSFSNRAWLTDEQIKSGLEFNRNALGFHIPKRFEHILHINKCYLQDDFANTVRNAIYQFAIDNDMSFYNVKFHEGNLRNVMIRNTSIGEWMLLLSFGENNDKNFELLDYIKTNFKNITSLNYAINTKKNDAVYDLDIQHYSGNTYIVEQLGNVRYKIGVKSFFQTNTAQAKKLYDTIIDFGNFSADEIVYDLYTGTGSIALYIAHLCKQVVGIEQIPGSY
ncbi:MAG: 23S rRNA (uracil(1939)-C(5))-methyltransferase RlmD [Chitinophagales bacterium]